MSPPRIALLVACVSTAPSACATSAPRPTASSDYGGTKLTAVEVCRPPGQRAYLQRLRCADGTPPQFERAGNVGPRNTPPADREVPMSSPLAPEPLQPGEVDYHIVDEFEVRCPEKTRAVFLDMYHCDVPPPERAALDFAIE